MDLKLYSISFLIFVFTLKCQTSIGEEVTNHGEKESLVRLERSNYYYYSYNNYYYYYYSYYDTYYYSYNNYYNTYNYDTNYYSYNSNDTDVDDITVRPVIYIAAMSACYLLSCFPCVVIGCIVCVFVCVEARNSRNRRANANVPLIIPSTPVNIPPMTNPDLQSYGYPQPVQTQGYQYQSPVPHMHYPGQPDPNCYPGYPMETAPPSYNVCQGAPQPYIGYQK